MQLINKIIFIILAACMIFACGCTQSEDIPEASNVESSESISEESVSNESLADDNSSIESVEPDISVPPDTRDDKISECVVITTEKTEYSVDERMKVFITTNHKDPDDLIYYGDGFWFEYYKDGEWHKCCEKDFMWTLESLCLGAITQYETTHYIKIYERIDEGYEKYRVVNEFHSDKHKPGLIYSNEFVLVP